MSTQSTGASPGSDATRCLSVALVVSGRPVLVVGGGTVAARKTADCREAGADITVVTSAPCDELGELARAGDIELRERAWERSDIEGCAVVIAATDDRVTNQAVADACRAAGIWVNVVDEPELCDFYTTAVMRRGDLAISVSTGGAYPALASAIRRDLETLYDDAWEEYVAVLAYVRRRLRELLPDQAVRSRLMRDLLSSDLLARIRARESIDGEEIARELVGQGSGHSSAGNGAHARVSIVGAGPGDADLITMRGLSAVRSANVIIYDRLASPELLLEAAPHAELVYVGKVAGHHAADQDAINVMLVERARRGLHVCRLKGGDPTVFGRGGEEALALAEAGIEFEFVPGVSSAYAAAESAGIPVTHRGVSSAVTFVTGHGAARSGGADVDWEALAEVPGTLVVLMGMKNIETITARLVIGGRDAETPAALVRWGCTPKQEVLRGSLGTIAARAREARWGAPSVIVVGDVVALGDVLPITCHSESQR